MAPHTCVPSEESSSPLTNNTALSELLNTLPPVLRDVSRAVEKRALIPAWCVLHLVASNFGAAPGSAFTAVPVQEKISIRAEANIGKERAA